MSHLDFDQDDIEILTELMNIGFGAAAADLSMMIDVMVKISVPKVQVMSIQEYTWFLDKFRDDHKLLTIANQSFQGKVSGSGIMILPGEDPFYILSNVDESAERERSIGIDILTDLTSLMVSTSVAKISELIDEGVTFEEPEVTCWKEQEYPEDMIRYDEIHIVLEAKFTMENGDHSGYLLLVTREESTLYLKEALNNFLENYG